MIFRPLTADRLSCIWTPRGYVAVASRWRSILLLADFLPDATMGEAVYATARPGLWLGASRLGVGVIHAAIISGGNECPVPKSELATLLDPDEIETLSQILTQSAAAAWPVWRVWAGNVRAFREAPRLLSLSPVAATGEA